MTQRFCIAHAVLFFTFCTTASAQSDHGPPTVSTGDYARAEQFLPWNSEKLVRNGDVPFGWIGTSDRFWYRRQIPVITQ